MARSFNGTNQYASLGAWDELDSSAVLTICLFAAVDSLADFAGILRNSETGPKAYGIALGGASGSGSNDVSVTVRDGSSRYLDTSANIIASGVMNHHAMTFDGSQAEANRIKFFLNGTSYALALRNTGSILTALPALTSHMEVARVSASSAYTNMRAAEVAAWNVVLTDAEIAAIAAGISPQHIRPASLLHYYPFLGGHAAEPDLRGESHATLAASPPVADHPPMHEELLC